MLRARLAIVLLTLPALALVPGRPPEPPGPAEEYAATFSIVAYDPKTKSWGVAVASREVPADNKIHDLAFETTIDKSSWVTLRQFPQLHTNPVNVIVAGKPIRASRKSALWCIDVIEQLWRVRGRGIAAPERDEAHKTFLKAIEVYRKIAAEAPEGS